MNLSSTQVSSEIQLYAALGLHNILFMYIILQSANIWHTKFCQIDNKLLFLYPFLTVEILYHYQLIPAKLLSNGIIQVIFYFDF